MTKENNENTGAPADGRTGRRNAQVPPIKNRTDMPKVNPPKKTS